MFSETINLNFQGGERYSEIRPSGLVMFLSREQQVFFIFEKSGPNLTGK